MKSEIYLTKKKKEELEKEVYKVIEKSLKTAVNAALDKIMKDFK